MKFKYLYILLLLPFFGTDTVFAGKDEKKRSSFFRKKSVNPTNNNNKQIEQRSFSVIPDKYVSENDNKKIRERRVSVVLPKDLSLLNCTQPQLPTAPVEDPKNLKRFSINQNSPVVERRGKKVEIWDNEEDLGIDSTKFENSLKKKKRENKQFVHTSVAVEFDMQKYHLDKDSYQQLVKTIQEKAPSASLDQGQKAVGLLMLYLKEPLALLQINVLFLGIPDITIKESTEYTKNRSLSLLVKKNLPYIDKNMVIQFFIEEGNLSLDEIAEKLNVDPITISREYEEIEKKIESEKNNAKQIQSVSKSHDEGSKHESKKTTPRSLDLDELNVSSEEENWDDF